MALGQIQALKRKDKKGGGGLGGTIGGIAGAIAGGIATVVTAGAAAPLIPTLIGAGKAVGGTIGKAVDPGTTGGKKNKVTAGEIANTAVQAGSAALGASDIKAPTATPQQDLEGGLQALSGMSDDVKKRFTPPLFAALVKNQLGSQVNNFAAPQLGSGTPQLGLLRR